MTQKAFFVTLYGLYFSKIIIGDTNFEYEQRWKVNLSFAVELGFSRSD